MSRADKYKDNNAVYIGKVRHGWQITELFYRYRGFDYSVTVYNNGYMNDKTLKEQHKVAQKDIDDKILHINDTSPVWNDEALSAFNWSYDLFNE